jgi:plastocyanin
MNLDGSYRMSVSCIRAATLAIAVLVVAAPSAPRAEQAAAIVIKDFDFSPMSLTVKAGSTVAWKNLDDEPHTVTSMDGLFRSGALDTGETFAHKFDRPGTYRYACSIHPRMMGTIVVQ